MQKGFTLFFAMLVAALALSIGLAIYDLTIREVDISSTVSQSEYAIYAADTGAECALYWDTHYTDNATNDNGGSKSAFATSSQDTLAIAANSSIAYCLGVDITSAAASWNQGSDYAQSSSAATSTFLLDFKSTTPSEPYCVYVTIAKSGTPSKTVIVAHGYNTCQSGSPLQLERALQVSY